MTKQAQILEMAYTQGYQNAMAKEANVFSKYFQDHGGRMSMNALAGAVPSFFYGLGQGGFGTGLKYGLGGGLMGAGIGEGASAMGYDTGQWPGKFYNMLSGKNNQATGRR